MTINTLSRQRHGFESRIRYFRPLLFLKCKGQWPFAFQGGDMDVTALDRLFQGFLLAKEADGVKETALRMYRSPLDALR